MEVTETSITGKAALDVGGVRETKEKREKGRKKQEPKGRKGKASGWLFLPSSGLLSEATGFLFSFLLFLVSASLSSLTDHGECLECEVSLVIEVEGCVCIHHHHAALNPNAELALLVVTRLWEERQGERTRGKGDGKRRERKKVKEREKEKKGRRDKWMNQNKHDKEIERNRRDCALKNILLSFLLGSLSLSFPQIKLPLETTIPTCNGVSVARPLRIVLLIPCGPSCTFKKDPTPCPVPWR